MIEVSKAKNYCSILISKNNLSEETEIEFLLCKQVAFDLSN